MKLIVLDMDGTLLNKHYVISEETKATLIKAQVNGATIVLASGRYPRETLPYAHELTMDQHHGVIISTNGAYAMDVESQEVLHDHPLKANETKQILKHLQNFDVVTLVTDNKFSYTSDQTRMHEIFNLVLTYGVNFGEKTYNLESKEIKDLANFVDFPLYKILCIGQPEYIQGKQAELLAPVKSFAYGMLTTPFAFEYTAYGMDKGATLQKVLALKGWQPTSIIAFGDGHNDLSLLEFADIGVAMGNAAQDLKDIADFVTSSHNDNGIVLGLKKYGFI